VKAYRILSDAASDADIEAAFDWYEAEQAGLGLGFLDDPQQRSSAYRVAVLSNARLSDDRPSVSYFDLETVVILAVQTVADPSLTSMSWRVFYAGARGYVASLAWAQLRIYMPCLSIVEPEFQHLYIKRVIVGI